jgi:hypothetical protein
LSQNGLREKRDGGYRDDEKDKKEDERTDEDARGEAEAHERGLSHVLRSRDLRFKELVGEG